VLFYPAALPLSRQTLSYTAGVIRRHRAQIGSPWRKLNPTQQALLVLAYLNKGETFAQLAAGSGWVPRRPGAMSARRWPCWRRGPRSCAVRWRRRRRPGMASWCPMRIVFLPLPPDTACSRPFLILG
jgi:hypothetical protein